MKSRHAVALLVAVIAAMVASQPARAAACTAGGAGNVLVIAGTAAADDIELVTDGALILCRTDGGAFGAVGLKTGIDEIYINPWNGNDSVTIGDGTRGAEGFDAEAITVDFGEGVGQRLVIDAGTSTDAEQMVFDGHTVGFDTSHPSVSVLEADNVAVTTGSGQDSFFVNAPLPHALEFTGGAGVDILVLNGTEGPDNYIVNDDLGSPVIASDTSATVREVSGIRDINIAGLGGDDSIVVTEPVDSSLKLFGGIGNDRIAGNAGDDQLAGGSGDDTLSGGGGIDMIFGFSGNDSLNGGDGNDVLRGEAGRDRLRGDAGNDALLGGDGKDRCKGGPGKDSFSSCERRRR